MINKEFYKLCGFTLDQILADYNERTKNNYSFSKPDIEKFLSEERVFKVDLKPGDIVQDSLDTLIITDVLNSGGECSIVYYMVNNVSDELIHIDELGSVALHRCLIPVFDDPAIHHYVKIGKCEEEILGKIRAKGKVIDDDHLRSGFKEQAETA